MSTSQTALIRLSDLKAASRALREAIGPNAPAHTTILNILSAQLGLGHTFSGACARSRHGVVRSSHLPVPPLPTARPDHTTAAPLHLLADDGWTRFAVVAEPNLDSAQHSTGLAPVPVDATFEPQAWMNDYAVAVDADGPCSFDATDFVLRTLLPALAAKDANPQKILNFGDALIESPNAPGWIAHHSGPFCVHYDEGLIAALSQAAQNGHVAYL